MSANLLFLKSDAHDRGDHVPTKPKFDDEMIQMQKVKIEQHPYGTPCNMRSRSSSRPPPPSTPPPPLPKSKKSPKTTKITTEKSPPKNPNWISNIRPYHHHTNLHSNDPKINDSEINMDITNGCSNESSSSSLSSPKLAPNLKNDDANDSALFRNKRFVLNLMP